MVVKLLGLFGLLALTSAASSGQQRAVRQSHSVETLVMRQAQEIEQLKADVKALTDRLDRDLPALQVQMENERKVIAFHADFENYTEHNYNISDHGIIDFDNIVLNEGRAYDNITGYFTAPVNGLYSFSVRYEMAQANYLFVSLNTEDGAQAYGVVGDAVWQSSGGLSSLLRLARGDKVWVERYSGTVGWLLAGHRSSFSGFLIHAEP